LYRIVESDAEAILPDEPSRPGDASYDQTMTSRVKLLTVCRDGFAITNLAIKILNALVLFLGLAAAEVHTDRQENSEVYNDRPVKSKYTDRRNLGFISNSVCRGVRAANPGSTCTCKGERLLRNRNTPLTVECVNQNAWVIPFIGSFSSKYNGSFFLFNDAKISTSKLCLSEVTGKYDVACIEGEHCEGEFDCYKSCKANVGGKACNSCNVCPDKTGAIVDCTNLVPFLKWSDCAGQNPVIVPTAPAAGAAPAPTAPVGAPVGAPFAAS
jgi:hypothetical protein